MGVEFFNCSTKKYNTKLGEEEETKALFTHFSHQKQEMASLFPMTKGIDVQKKYGQRLFQ